MKWLIEGHTVSRMDSRLSDTFIGEHIFKFLSK